MLISFSRTKNGSEKGKNETGGNQTMGLYFFLLCINLCLTVNFNSQNKRLNKDLNDLKSSCPDQIAFNRCENMPKLLVFRKS